MTLDLLSTKAALERLTGMAEKQKWTNGQTAETMEPRHHIHGGGWRGWGRLVPYTSSKELLKQFGGQKTRLCVNKFTLIKSVELEFS